MLFASFVSSTRNENLISFFFSIKCQPGKHFNNGWSLRKMSAQPVLKFLVKNFELTLATIKQG